MDESQRLVDVVGPGCLTSTQRKCVSLNGVTESIVGLLRVALLGSFQKAVKGFFLVRILLT